MSHQYITFPYTQTCIATQQGGEYGDDLSKNVIMILEHLKFLSFTAPSPLEATFSFTISGSTVKVCVETKEAVLLKLILRDVNDQRYVRECKGCY